MVIVKLIFIGKLVDPELVSQELGVLQDEAIADGTNNKDAVVFNQKSTSNIRKWTFSKLSTGEDDVESGAYEEWCKFLLEKSGPLDTLRRQGYEGYLEISLPATGNETYIRNNAFIDSPLVEILGGLGLGISVWFKEPSSTHVISDNFKLAIPEPIEFFCQLDERLFYNGLESIGSVKSFQVEAGKPFAGIPNNIVLTLISEVMDDESLRQLIGLMFRYSLTMSSLQAQCTENNVHWFRNTSAYWYQSVFGSMDDN